MEGLSENHSLRQELHLTKVVLAVVWTMDWITPRLQAKRMV